MTTPRKGLNATHEPQLRSWLESANQPSTDFPIQNLPFGVFRRAGSLFRPDNPLLPNYKHVPIAYNGRANSVRCASFVQRPVDQLNPPGAAGPVFAPSERLDYEVELGAYIGTPSKTSSARMRELGLPAMQLSRSQVASLYGSFGQMVAHHTSNGTISGPTADALGCLLEITEGGRKTLDLPSDEERRFLQDDDEVVMRGFCERDGFARIGFGECRATIAPSHVV